MALSEPIIETDTEVCHLTRNADCTPNIIVQFKSRTKRDSVLQKAKKSRLLTHELGFSPGPPLFVNEHLCPMLEHLLGMALAQKSEKLAICMVKQRQDFDQER